MNNETAIIVGLVLALIIVASVYAATEGTLEIAGDELNELNRGSGEGELVDTGLQDKGALERGGEKWQKERYIYQL